MTEEKLSLSVLVALRRIMRAVYLHSRKLETEYKLTGPQQILLNIIVRGDGIPICRLAKAVNLSNATTSGIVDRLEKRNVVVRERSTSDRRTVYVRATEAGRQTIKNTPPSLQEQFVEAFDRLPPREQSKILQSLEKVASMLKADGLDVAPVLWGQAFQESDKNQQKGY